MKLIYKVGLGILLLIIIVGAFFYDRGATPGQAAWGLTFSYQAARGLGFDDRVLYMDMLTDLKPASVRLMTYWEDVEPERGKFDFSLIDWQLEQAQKSNTRVVLALGRKQPRWPECHQPNWYHNLSEKDKELAVLEFVKSEVEHFKQFSVIDVWQVENEPYFVFGPDCARISKELLTQEVQIVKSLDNRPIMITDSGDRGSWIGPAKAGADILGVTIYRVSYDKKYGGYYKYPLPPAFYQIRSGILKTFTETEHIWDAELQLEPWFTAGALNTDLALQKTLMNQKVFADNIRYAKKSGLRKHYLWGVEWWYWMAQKHNDWGMWTAAKDLLSTEGL